MFLNVSSSPLRQWQWQWYATLCCSFGSGLTASSVMAYNSILVESLQKDPDTKFTFEETSWFCKNVDPKIGKFPNKNKHRFSLMLGLHGHPRLFYWRPHLAGRRKGSLGNAINITGCLGLVLTYALSILVTWRPLAWLLTVPAVLAVLGKILSL